MPLLSSHHSSYISVFLCLLLTADTPTTSLFWLLHFCLSKRREETDLYFGSVPRHFLQEWQRHLLIFLGVAEVWVAVFFFFFLTCGLTRWHQLSPNTEMLRLHYTRREALSILRSGLWEQQLAVGQTLAQHQPQADLMNKTSRWRWRRVDCNQINQICWPDWVRTECISISQSIENSLATILISDYRNF